MGNFRMVYRGYVIHVFGETPAWSFRAEPMRPKVPLLGNPVEDGHGSKSTDCSLNSDLSSQTTTSRTSLPGPFFWGSV
jgi:hypothetical protein